MRSGFCVSRRCESSLSCGCFGREERDQRIAIALLALAVAKAVDLQLQILHAAAAIEIHLKQDALDVLLRLGDAEGFDAELVVLAEPARLRALVAEVRADVEDLRPRALVVEQAAFDHRADDAGGAFGAKGDRSVAAVVEGVHFLVDDVAGFADAAVKQFGVLEDRRADFGEVIDARRRRGRSARRPATSSCRPGGCRRCPWGR